MSSSFLDVRQPVTYALLLRPETEKIESSTDVLKGILRPVVEGVEEISWPPREPEAINQMEKVSKEDKDKPRLAAKLQKVLQLYAAMVLSKPSYAKKGSFLKSLAHSKLPLSTNRISSRLHPITGNQVVKVEHFLETLIKAPEEQWNKFFLEGLTLGKSEVTPEELSAIIKKRIERTLIRTVRRKFIPAANLDRVSQRDRVQSK
ncbi:BnaC04g14210D [Brassica napus]|uniref:BnaC04g14210D protein n=1 Tax=Brassica napus TaxID=3708 RepID=A0A078HTW6_BRANA|nr:BnaC04g14210D [Brassica napus]